ncbi:hypothetical protein PAHAL_3G330500 [Panicum hallii]|uniref:Uncharacterized protein n=1 Tax=Panicum hallii TaxID=206008 RepID=A0A2T8KK81_9POAL|nr:hypothetical protein PAHAL_3G330500 [Panicum hallii]
MAQSGRTPFGDISNTIGTGTQDTSNTTPHALDQKELKRQRERERYAGMSAEQKAEKNKKRPMSGEKRAEINKKR